MTELFQTALFCITITMVTFLVFLALPQCQLRSFLKPIVGWAMAACCGLYVVSPVDIVPEVLLGPVGCIDDIAAIFAGISAAKMAMKSDDDA